MGGWCERVCICGRVGVCVCVSECLSTSVRREQSERPHSSSKSIEMQSIANLRLSLNDKLGDVEPTKVRVYVVYGIMLVVISALYVRQTTS